MHTLKRSTLGIYILHFLLMFQIVSQADTITRPVTYRDSITLIEPVKTLTGFISGEDTIDWEGHVPGEDAPVRVSFEVYVDPGHIDTEINAQVILDRETHTPRVEPRWTRNDICDQFIGKFSTRGGIRIGGNLVIDISIGQPFLSSEWKVNREVPLSAFNALLPVDVLPENLDKSWDEAVYFNSRLDGTGEPITLEPTFEDLLPFELSAADIIEAVLAYFSVGATKAVDTGLTVAAGAFSTDEEEEKKQKGALRTVIEKILGNAGFNLNGGLAVELALSDVKAGIAEGPTIAGDTLIVRTRCDGELSAQLFLTLSADFSVKFEVLGVEVWSKEAKIAKEKYPLTNAHQVEDLSIEGSPDSVEFPVKITSEDFTQWDLPGGAIARLGKGTTHDMDYSPNGALLAVGTTTGAWLYDADTGEELALLRSGSGHNTYNITSSVRFSGDGKTLATSMGGASYRAVYLWDVATRTQKPYLRHTAGRVKSFNADGTVLATIRGDKIVVWDVATETEKLSFRYRSGGVSLSPDGNTLASSTDYYTKKVGLWNVETGEHIADLTGYKGYIYSVHFSPDGGTLAGAGDDGKIYLWDVKTQILKTVLLGHTNDKGSDDDVVSLSFSRDGSTLASGGDDGTVRLWDVDSGQRIALLTGHLNSVWRVSFGRDDNTLASFSVEDATVNMWDLTTRIPKFTISGYRSHEAGDSQQPVIFSPDGKTLASIGSSDGAIHLWDVDTGRQRAILNGCLGGGRIVSASFSPDGTILASVGHDRMMRIWDVDTGQEMTFLKPDLYVTHVFFSPDGKTLAGTSPSGTVHLWNVDTWTQRAVLTHPNGFRSMRFSPDKDSQILATVKNDSSERLGKVLLWDVTTGQEIGVLKHPDLVFSVSFSPDGETLASAGEDGMVRLWNVDTQQEITFLKHDSPVSIVSFSPDGETLASAGDGWVWLRNADTRSEIVPLTEVRFSYIGHLFFSPDGKTLASVSGIGERKLHLWDVETRSLIVEYTYRHNALFTFSFSPDSKTLASLGYEEGTVYLWDVATGKKKKFTVIQQPSGVYSASFSPDSKTLASGGGHSSDEDAVVRLWDVDTRSEIATLTAGHKGAVRSVSFSAVKDSKIKMLASGGDYGLVQLWDIVNVDTPREIAMLTGPTEAVSQLTFSPDGKRLASIEGVHGGKLCLWDTEKYTKIATPPAPGYHFSVSRVSFSPDSETLAGACSDGMVRLWNTDTGTEMDAPRGPTEYVFSVVFSPDGKTLAVAGGEKTDTGWVGVVYLWDVDSLTKIDEIRMQRDGIIFVSFSPDSRTLALANQHTATVRLWDIATGTEKPGFTHGSPIRSVSFSPDGKTLATSDHYGARLWDVATRTPIVSVRSGQVDDVIFSPDGSTLALLGSGRISWLSVPASVTHLAADVNGDGIVNIQDLIVVSAALGETDENDADVNGDGIVNIQDLIVVSAALGETAAAPTIAHQQGIEHLTQAEVQQWITQAERADLTDPTSKRGIRFLHYLLTVLTPKETELLANYPNPFNPETWIPYQLAKPAEVTLHIYAVNGTLVRILTLGHQTAGMYHSKNRAAYWDGRNAHGERVASGIYFYTLSAGEFTATRKMLIRK